MKSPTVPIWVILCAVAAFLTGCVPDFGPVVVHLPEGYDMRGIVRKEGKKHIYVVKIGDTTEGWERFKMEFRGALIMEIISHGQKETK